METSITQTGTLTYNLEINALADDLADDVARALRKQRKVAPLKGFRPGKAPLSIIGKLYKKEVSASVVESFFKEICDDLVFSSYDVIVGPETNKLDYTLHEDLQATLTFGVKPEVVLKDISGETIDIMVHAVTDEEIEQAIENIRKGSVSWVPLGEEDTIMEGDRATFDLQEVDSITRAPLIGKNEKGLSRIVSRESDDAGESEFADAVIGAQVNSTVQMTLTGDANKKSSPNIIQTLDEKEKTVITYQVTITQAQRGTLPELDDAFARKASFDACSTMEELRLMVGSNLKMMWSKRCMEVKHQNVMDKMIKLHPIEVPQILLDRILNDLSDISDISEEDRQAAARKRIQWEFIASAIKDTYSSELREELDSLHEQLSTTSSEELSEEIMLLTNPLSDGDGGENSENENDAFITRLMLHFLGKKFQQVEKSNETAPQELEQ